MRPSLHAQASAVSVMSGQARQRGNLKLKPVQWEHLEPSLQAAVMTLTLLEAARRRPGVAELLAEIEAGA